MMFRLYGTTGKTLTTLNKPNTKSVQENPVQTFFIFFNYILELSLKGDKIILISNHLNGGYFYGKIFILRFRR